MLESWPALAEVAASLFIEKQAILRLLQLDRELEPAHVEGRFVQIQQSLDEKGVVIRETFDSAPLAIAAREDFFCLIVKLVARESGGPRSPLQDNPGRQESAPHERKLKSSGHSTR